MTEDSEHRQRRLRSQGLCEQAIWRGSRQGQDCRNRAIYHVSRYDQRVCGVHARAAWGIALIGPKR